MATSKKPQEKSRLHPRNKNRDRYDLNALIIANPDLKAFVKPNKHGDDSVDFANPKAVKILNKALLNHYYGIAHWDFPDSNLCPPIPGRADYIHYLADLLCEHNFGRNPNGAKIKCLDVGVGANCIYPLLGNAEYQWNFIGTDIDKKSLDRAEKIIKKNGLSEVIKLKQQKDATQIFQGILNEDAKFSATICNPPFYKSQEDAMLANARKLEGLGKQSDEARNFSGKQQELWYKGGEKAFIHAYLYESSMYKTQCFWYTTLVSKKENAESMLSSLKKLGATEIKTIPMHQGNKVTRIVAWTFLSKEEQLNW